MRTADKNIVFGIGIALIAATTLKAEDEDRIRFGVGISIVGMTEDKTKIELGFGPFFTTETNLTDKQTLRGKLGYVYFSEGQNSFEAQTNKQIKNSLNVEVDWVYNFNSNNHCGPYVFGGAGVMNNIWKSTRFDQSKNLYSGNYSNLSPALAIGVGFRLFKWLEFEYREVYIDTGRR